MEQERVRIADIAEELGVSTATVSNVIHGKTQKISAETVRRVEMLLEKRQYIPSMAGILLAQNASKIIGVAINRHDKYEHHVLQDPFISESLDCLEREITAQHCFMMVKCTPDPAEIVRFGSMWNMEGMIVLGFCGEDYEMLRAKMHIPFVVYDGYAARVENYCNLSVDDFSGGYQMGEYLWKLGHRKILFLADNDICMDHQRYCGLCAALQKAGCAAPEHAEIPLRRAARLAYYEANLPSILQYTAVFAASDAYAIELMNFLTDHGVQVPQQISVAGFDGIPESAVVRPALTTIRQDGGVRAHLALALLRQEKAGTAQYGTSLLPVGLQIGSSTAPLRGNPAQK
ncbi:MAG: LacI family transcriptional regulator [Faecalibacterium sp.]|jgi:LacI family transcriptional regulator|nr:LacI family transcriptional regulator [Faecalibacterium sp.]